MLMVLEKVDSEASAGIEDLVACSDAVRRVYPTGNVNQRNSMPDCKKG